MFDSVDRAHIRLLWGVVDTHSLLLAGLSDEAIGYWILKRVQERLYLNTEEISGIQTYIAERIHLIREIVSAENS